MPQRAQWDQMHSLIGHHGPGLESSHGADLNQHEDDSADYLHNLSHPGVVGVPNRYCLLWLLHYGMQQRIQKRARERVTRKWER